MSSRPLVLPETFNGEAGNWDEWIDHFESVAAVNGWETGADKLKWLRVRLTGRALTAFKRIPEPARNDYDECKAALKKRYEPESKRELYVAEFQAKKKGKTEDWATLGDELKVLADKAYPDLEEKARERLALNSFLAQIDNPQVAFSVRQKRPETVDAAVAATLEMESYLGPKASHVGQVVAEEEVEAAAVASKPDPQMELLQKLVVRLDCLEARLAEGKLLPPESSGQSGGGKREATGNTFGSGRRDRGPIICRKCGQEGHIARGCASRRQAPGNY